MMRKTAYIIEDESLARDALLEKLKLCPQIDILGYSGSVKKAIREIEEKKPEVLFLDIQLSDGTGFDLLNQIGFKGQVIFTTAYDEYAIRAFEINALDYLLKPISQVRLDSAIDKLFKIDPTVSKPDPLDLKLDDRLLVGLRSTFHFIQIRNITLISAAKDYTEITTSDGRKYLVMKTMGDWEERLPSNQFVRIHRSAIINVDFVDRLVKHSYNAAEVFLKGCDQSFVISKSYYGSVKNKFSL